MVNDSASLTLVAPTPGTDLVPDGWCETTVIPWADAQGETTELASATAVVAGLIEAYRTLNQDTLELVKARRYLEVRWGELLGEGERGSHGRGRPLDSHASESIGKDDRHRFRQLAEHREEVVAKIKTATDADALSRSALLKVARETSRQEVREARRAETLELPPEVRYQSYVSDIADLGSHITEPADVIVTDPPYPREYLPTFGELARLAVSVLKPGGLCVVLSGQSYLPEVMAHLGEHLDYYWTGAYMLPGQPTPLRQRNVNCSWKPLLVYANDASQANPRIFGDVFRSDRNEKDWHHWGQSISGMLDVVDRLTEPGDVVLDPFIGGGATAVAALELDRSVVAADVDPDQIAISDARVAEWWGGR